MILDDETLAAYADGEAEDAREIRRALKSRPHLAQRVEAMRALRDSVAGAYAPIANQAVPPHLAALLAAPAAAAVRPRAIPGAVAVGLGVLAAAGVAAAYFALSRLGPERAPNEPPSVTIDKGLVIAPPDGPQAPDRMIVSRETPRQIINPHWLSRPNGRDFERYYPERALERGVSGHAVLNCKVRLDGTLNCLVALEDPGGWGFGEAALKLSQTFRMAPKTVDGEPTADANVNVPITFKLGR